MPTTGPDIRLQKFLAHSGICSRRKAETHILEGRVKVNAKTVTELGTKVNPRTDQVWFDGRPVTLPTEEAHTYILVNKPPGVITSCSRTHGKIILDLVKTDKRVYPVGRLDKDSEGLVLLTDDGQLHNLLSHPSHDHEKEYRVKTLNSIPDAALDAMARGMMIDGVKTRKAKVSRLGKDEFKMVLKQGLNRQIRKMVGKTGNHVTRLLRVRMASVTLGTLKPGEWRHLTPKEIKRLTSHEPVSRKKNKKG